MSNMSEMDLEVRTAVASVQGRLNDGNPGACVVLVNGHVDFIYSLSELTTKRDRGRYHTVRVKQDASSLYTDLAERIMYSASSEGEAVQVDYFATTLPETVEVQDNRYYGETVA